MDEGKLGMITEALCENESCLVVGSAPNLQIPDQDFGCVIGVNGGAAIARDKGIQVDILVTTSYLFRDGIVSKAEQYTLDTMNDLEVDHIWVDTQSGPVNFLVKECLRRNIKYLDIFEANPEDRSEVVEEAVGEGLWVSSGVWAACLAYVSGSKSINLAGISLTNGHYGMVNDTAQRFHTAQDKRCLSTLKSLREISW